jgi:hydroxyacylglutathione hydrolase
MENMISLHKSQEGHNMHVTPHVHAIKIPFTIPVGPGVSVDRFVYAFLIYAEKICLIDCGVTNSKNVIFDYVRQAGRNPRDILLAVITHAHPDHMGGAQAIRQEIGCMVTAHTEDVAWIEDTARQLRERPVPGFASLVEGPAKVDLPVKDNDGLDFGKEGFLRVIHTPGHSRGHIALFHEEDGALFCGDAIPLPGSVPIYEDVTASIQSIKKLKAIQGVKVLLSSWDEPRFGDSIGAAMNEGIEYLERVHEAVLNEKSATPSATPMDLTAKVLRSLGLPDTPLPPMVVTSIEAHLRLIDSADSR